MGKTIFDISMALDGFITAADETAEEPMGAGGEPLHQWPPGWSTKSRSIRVPVLFGAGTRIFEGLPEGRVSLEPLATVPTPSATHVRYGIAR